MDDKFNVRKLYGVYGVHLHWKILDKKYRRGRDTLLTIVI